MRDLVKEAASRNESLTEKKWVIRGSQTRPRLVEKTITQNN